MPTIITTKTFHNNNLILQLLYHPDFNIYSINIFQVNSSENHNIFGIFQTFPAATTKFNQISL